MSSKTTLPTMVLRPPSGFVHDKTKDGWTLIEGAEEQVVGELMLALYELLRKGESYVGGETMIKRARELGRQAGQCHAELVLAQEKSIPEEYRDYALVFSETVWRDDLGNRSVPVLHWDGEQWYLRRVGLAGGFGSRCRLVGLGE